MSIQDIPTPESDEVFGPRVMGVRSNKCRDLERRLTVARRALWEIANNIFYTSEAEDIAEEALTRTAPKQ